jgi:hypothetical protein
MKSWFMGVSLGAMLIIAPAVMADEGMWTLDNLPIQQMKERYGFSPSQAWLSRVQKASVRLAEGCSGSFVSSNGLVMTNHHCANACLSQLSKTANYMENGFSTVRREDEPKCPEVELNQLDAISDVTDRVLQATRGKDGAQRVAAERAIHSELEKGCVGGDAKTWRCDVVTLYHGGRYALYKYRRFQDVRLVFAPEQSIAFFGGDPDNFNFPRYDLDVTFFRAYVDGKPAQTPDYLPFDPNGPKTGDMTFVVGNPGSTQRDVPWAQLEDMRDHKLVPIFGFLSELRGVLWDYSRADTARAKEAQDLLFGLDNSLKVYRGWLETLTDHDFQAKKTAGDGALSQWIAADPARKAKFGDPWSTLAKAQQRSHELQERYGLIEGGRGFGVGGQLFTQARTLVRAVAERGKPDGERLPAYRDANLPALEQEVASTAPVYPAFETTLLSWSVEKMRQALGADDPFVHEVLGKQSPEQFAAALVTGTTLADPKKRKALWDGGKAAIDASTDPMIVLARRIDPEARALRKQYEDEVSAPVSKAEEAIAQARFAKDGTASYPDATFTPRLSFGKVVGWREKGADIAPFTDFKGAFSRATGADPFKLPDSWLKAKSSLDLATPFDFVTDNDIIGGNSGSPVIDREGHAVGLIFDGNIHSLGGDFTFDATRNRAVAVDSAALLEAIKKVYRLPRLAEELASP